MERKRILHGVGLLVLVAVVVPFVIYAIPAVVGAEHSFVVLSGSMEPGISAGDVVIVDERPAEDISEGDVVTFVRGESGKPVTHRVIGVEERAGTTVFETKGDANEDADPEPVPASNVIGTVGLTIPYIGHVVLFAQTPVGFVSLVLLPLVLLGLSEAWSVVSSDGPTGEHGGTTAAAGNAAPASSDAGDVSDTVAGTDDGNDSITFTVADLTLSTGLLALVAPYTVYVALQLRNAVTFTAAFAAGFVFVTVAGLWVVAKRGDDDGAVPGDGPDGDLVFNDGGEPVDPTVESEDDGFALDGDGVEFDLSNEPDVEFGDGVGSDDGPAAEPDPFDGRPPKPQSLDSVEELAPTDTEEVD